MTEPATTLDDKYAWTEQLLAAGWVAALRKECERTSQKKAAAVLGISGSAVNQILNGRYGGPFGGDIERMQNLVEGAFMHATVQCPVLGELARNRCLEHQRARFAVTNPTRVQLYHTCPTCPNRRK